MVQRRQYKEGRRRARFTVTPQSPVIEKIPEPFVPEHLLNGVFAHSVRTFNEGGMTLIDFSYAAPLEWRHGPDGEFSFEHVVVARVLMPEYDFREWIRKAAMALSVPQQQGD